MGLELFFEAFLDLNTCRQSGWSLSHIPWTAIANYAKVNGFHGEEDEQELFFFVREMDRGYLEYHKEKEKLKKK